MTNDVGDLAVRLALRAQIRRQIPGRKSVQEGRPDRIADILDEAAETITRLDNNYTCACEEIAALRREIEHLK